MRKYKHLSYEKRLKLETLFNKKFSISQIAKELGVNYSTVSRELQKGKYPCLNSNYQNVIKYSADIAHKKYLENLKAKGKDIKLQKDFEYANYLVKKLKEEKLSPQAILGEIEKKKLKFNTKICFKTFYNYLDKGVFFEIDNNNLLIKPHKKRKYIRTYQKFNKRIYGISIEKRTDEINSRKNIGHWEIDCVIGKKSDHKCFFSLDRTQDQV